MTFFTRKILWALRWDKMIASILAIDKNWCIWKNNNLCWHLKQDLKFFSDKTKGQVVIMGKNTYLSLPEQVRPLPWRINYVISNTLKDEKVEVFSSLKDALINAKSLKKEIFLIWGKTIYEQGIDFCDKVFITRLNKSFDCDVCLWAAFYKKLFLEFTLQNKTDWINENNIQFRFEEYFRF